MKKLIFFISLVISVSAFAQDKPSYFIGLPGQTSHARGNLRVDSTFLNALRDTTFTPWRLGLQVFRPADSSLYVSTSIVAAKKWTKLGAASGGAVWGTITGTLGSQTDLQAALDAKQDVITPGTVDQYIRGDFSLGNFTSAVTAISDPLYAQLAHTHIAADITDFTVAARNVISAGSGLSYNPATGVMSYPGAGVGITELNGLTGSVQTFAFDTTATDFSISSVGTLHTFNIPLSRLEGGSFDTTTIYSNLALKVPTSRTLTINGSTQDLSANRTWNVGTVTSFGKTDGYGITSSVANSTTTPNHTIAVDSAALSAKYLLRNDTTNIIATKTDITNAFAAYTPSNIYNSDGSLTTNRTVNLNGKTLTFDGGNNSSLEAYGLRSIYWQIDDNVFPQILIKGNQDGSGGNLFEISSTGSSKETGLFIQHSSYSDSIPQITLHAGGIPTQTKNGTSPTQVRLRPNNLLFNLNPTRNNNWTVWSPNSTTDGTAKLLVWNPADSTVKYLTDLSALGLSNLATADQTATGDRTHDWNYHSLQINNLGYTQFKAGTSTNYTLNSFDSTYNSLYLQKGSETYTFEQNAASKYTLIRTHGASAESFIKEFQDSLIVSQTAGDIRFKNVATGPGVYQLRIDATGKITKADTTSGGGYTNLTSFVAQNNWKVFYSDGSGDVQELALGASGTALKSNGATSAPSFGAVGDAILANNQTFSGVNTFSNYIALTEMSAPATPSAGTGRVYGGTDKKPHYLNSDGTNYDLTAAALTSGYVGFGSSGSLTGSSNLQFNDVSVRLTVNGVVQGSTLDLVELATIAGSTPASGYGKYWVKDDGTPHFINDAGVDIQLGASGGSGETNTASNLGGGLANYSTKVGVDLRFNSFDAADFDLASNLISIDATKWLTQSSAASTFQATLVSATNIKTINGSSILGSGDLSVTASAAGSDTYVQFNDGGTSLGGDAGMVYNKTTDKLTLAGAVTAPYLYGGDKTTTYAGYSGAILGGSATHGVLDFWDNGSRIGEFYTDASSFNFFADLGKELNFYTNSDFSAPLINASVYQTVGIKTNNHDYTFQVNGVSAFYQHILGAEIAAPSTPASGYAAIYAKSDGLWYGKDDAGLETKLSNEASATAATASTLALRDANGNITANNWLGGYTTTATAAGTTTLTVASSYLQYFTGSTTQTVTLPVVSTLALGTQYVIVNNSTGNVTVNSSGGNAVVVLAGGTSTVVTSIATTGTTAAAWSQAYSGVNIASGKKVTQSNTLTYTGTDGSTVAFGAGGTVAYTANDLSVFASTTSAQLGTLLSDETGSGGGFVRATAPVLNNPTIGISGTASSAQIKTVGSVPTVSQTGAGSGGSVGVAVETGSTDMAGTITITTGNASVGSTGTVTLTFNQAYTGNTPVVLLTLVKGATDWGALATARITTQSTSAPIITWNNSATGAAAALTTNTTYKISYIVISK